MSKNSEDLLNQDTPVNDIQIQTIKSENTEDYHSGLDQTLPDRNIDFDCSQLFEPKQEIEIGNEELVHISSSVEDFKNIIESEYFTKEGYNKKKFACEICTKAFKTKRELTIHGAVHVDLRPFSCYECQKSFKLKSHLLSHVKIHRNLKPFICDVCGKSFRLRQQLDVHSISHSDERAFTCCICEKSFKLKNSLETHKLVHLDIKPFSCDVCGKSFKLKQQLQNHQQTHNNFKPFQCLICGKSFKMKQQLQNHEKTHTDSRPYGCELCGKSFKFNQRLQVHYKVHFTEPSEKKKRGRKPIPKISSEQNSEGEDQKSFQEVFLDSMSFAAVQQQLLD